MANSAPVIREGIEIPFEDATHEGEVKSGLEMRGKGLPVISVDGAKT